MGRMQSWIDSCLCDQDSELRRAEFQIIFFIYCVDFFLFEKLVCFESLASTILIIFEYFLSRKFNHNIEIGATLLPSIYMQMFFLKTPTWMFTVDKSFLKLFYNTKTYYKIFLHDTVLHSSSRMIKDGVPLTYPQTQYPLSVTDVFTDPLDVRARIKISIFIYVY